MKADVVLQSGPKRVELHVDTEHSHQFMDALRTLLEWFKEPEEAPDA